MASNERGVETHTATYMLTEGWPTEGGLCSHCRVGSCRGGRAASFQCRAAVSAHSGVRLLLSMNHLGGGSNSVHVPLGCLFHIIFVHCTHVTVPHGSRSEEKDYQRVGIRTNHLLCTSIHRSVRYLDQYASTHPSVAIPLSLEAQRAYGFMRETSNVCREFFTASVGSTEVRIDMR